MMQEIGGNVYEVCHRTGCASLLTQSGKHLADDLGIDTAYHPQLIRRRNEAGGFEQTPVLGNDSGKRLFTHDPAAGEINDGLIRRSQTPRLQCGLQLAGD